MATAAPTLITYLGAAMVLGIVGSLLLARWIKRQTLGLEPAEIAAVVEQREAIFTGIAEGVIALDPSDRVTMVNPLAAQLLSLPTDTVGQSLDELTIEGRLRDVLTGVNGDEPDAVVIRSGRVLVLNRMPVVHDGRTIGSVTTLRDRTQLADLESEIGAFRGTTDLLRAQTHEFANQLHTISGLIQIGDYDEVVSYVDALTEGRAALDLTVARRVRDRPVAALLVAKSAVAAERQVSLRVSQQTNLDPLEPSCLLRRGHRARQPGPERDRRRHQRPGVARVASWVQVEIHQSGRPSSSSSATTGPGVDATIATEVFEHGFTTKAAQDGERGIGLALTRLICRRRGGEVEINNTADGARFVARMTITPAEARRARVMITVLVVDDDFRVARIHSAFVDRIEGFRTVGVAHNGAEAVAMADRSCVPDLILLDLYLPDVFGLDVLNQMRVAGVEGDVIVISAANESEAVERALKLGVASYLLKPFTLDDLASRLAEYKAQRQRRSQPRRRRPGRRRSAVRPTGGAAGRGVAEGHERRDRRVDLDHAAGCGRGAVGPGVRRRRRHLPGQCPPLPGVLRGAGPGAGVTAVRQPWPPRAPLPAGAPNS